MDKNFNEEDGKRLEEIYKRKELRIKAGIILFLIIVVFCSSYIITDRLTNPEYKNKTANKIENTVYNNTKALDDETKIILKSDGKVESEEDLEKFKDERDITSDVTQQFLVEYFKNEGYTLEKLTNDKLVLSRSTDSEELEPNKYYLGEKDGYFAIYKTDENGKAFIENEDDIYKNSIKVDNLPASDQSNIKGFKYGYDSKDEAKEMLSGYIS